MGLFCVHSLRPVPTSIHIFLRIIIHTRLLIFPLFTTVLGVWVESLALRHGGEHGVEHPPIIRHEPDFCHSTIRIILVPTVVCITRCWCGHGCPHLIHQPHIYHEVQALLVEHCQVT